MSILQKATDNRWKCTVCAGKVNKGERCFRDSFKGWRASHVVNICKICIAKMAAGVGATEEDLVKYRKEAIVEELEGETKNE